MCLAKNCPRENKDHESKKQECKENNGGRERPEGSSTLQVSGELYFNKQQYREENIYNIRTFGGQQF